MQIELLVRRNWPTRAELATALFEWIEAFYNPKRRHSLGYLAPIEVETLHADAATAACSIQRNRPVDPGQVTTRQPGALELGTRFHHSETGYALHVAMGLSGVVRVKRTPTDFGAK